MSIRKFGTGPDQRVVRDDKDKQGVRKEASQKFTEKDREELKKESEK